MKGESGEWGMVSSCFGRAAGCLQVGSRGQCGEGAGVEHGGARWCHGGYSSVPPNSMSGHLPHSHVTLRLGCQTAPFGAKSLLLPLAFPLVIFPALPTAPSSTDVQNTSCESFHFSLLCSLPD